MTLTTKLDYKRVPVTTLYQPQTKLFPTSTGFGCDRVHEFISPTTKLDQTQKILDLPTPAGSGCARVEDFLTPTTTLARMKKHWGIPTPDHQNGPEANSTAPGSGCDRVEDWMTPIERAVILTPDMPMRTAAETLLSNSITGAPVVSNGRLVGVLTQFDFLYQVRVCLVELCCNKPTHVDATQFDFLYQVLNA